jgi:hypothetical protein
VNEPWNTVGDDAREKHGMMVRMKFKALVICKGGKLRRFIILDCH